MAKLIRSRNGRWFTSFFFFVVALATLFFAFANRSGQVAAAPPGRGKPAAPGGPNFPTYITGNFVFTNPVQLVRPASPAFFQQGGEPEIKTDIFSNIYVTAIQGVPGGVDLWKSKDNGTSFVYMGEPDGAQDHCATIPQCAGLGGGDDSIDVSNGGYLYISSLWLGSVTASTSYDGATGGTTGDQAWKVHPSAASPGVDDRQWLAAYGPQTVYMTYASTSLTNPPGVIGLFVVKSTDAGKTWSAPTEISGITPLNSVDEEGNLVVDKYNGNLYTAYLPSTGANVINLARSTDGGATWSIVTAYTGPAGTSNRGTFPILAVDRGGNLYLTFTQISATRTAHVLLMSTSNPAAATPTWTTPVQVDNGAATNTAVDPWIVGGSPGVVDVTWLGSPAGSPDIPSNWHVYFAQVTNANTGSPTIAQNQVETAVMHDHSICFNGSGCASNGTSDGEPGNRDLLEYYTMTIDQNGNANIAYADSINNCPSATCTTNAWFTKQTAGPSALTPPAPPTASTFAANVALPLGPGSPDSPAEPNMKADSHNCLFSAAPGNPDAWKSTNAGTSFFLLPNPVVGTGLTGGDEEILPVTQISGARPDQLYFADLGVSTVHISKSTDGGSTWFAPGPSGAAGEVSASVDRQWMSWDRNGANTTVYLWEHEFVSQVVRMSALTNDTAWSPFANGMTDPELVALASTVGNTVPGPTFVDTATHVVYGFLSASTPTTNAIGAPTGKLPNVWEADGAGTFTSGVPAGPFTNHPVFKGVIDSPTSPAPPAGSSTIGSNTANLFNGATIDRAGNIYATWATPNARTGLYEVWFASSHDHGQTYYGPFKINPNGIQGNMPWITAGDNGRVEIVYYGTTGTEDPTTSTHDQWNVFFAQSLNGADREPVFTVSQASDHVTHIGQICNVGILCGANTRNLLDFFQVAIGPDGLANIAWADTGSQPPGPQNSQIFYARQSGGPLGLTNPTSPTCLPGPPVPTVVSRKTHGSAGTFDINMPLTPTSPGIECRTGGASGNHTLVMTFPLPVTFTSATVCSGTGSVSSSSGSGTNTITVNLTGVTNAQRLNVCLNNATDGTNTGTVTVPVGILAGDTNADGTVNSADVSQTKAQSGAVVTSSNFREDVTVEGTLNSADVSLVKSKSGTALP